MSTPLPWVLLRGLMRDQRHWGAFPQQFSHLLDDAPICLLDLPGNGLLNQQTSPSSVPTMANWVRAELLRRKLAPPYRVLAMSLGAMVTVAWANAHPEELDAAVLINTSLRPISPFYHRLQPAAWPLLLRMALSRPDALTAEAGIHALTSQQRELTQTVLADWVRWRQSHPVSTANALRQLLAAARYRAPRTAPLSRLLLLNAAGDRLVNPHCSQTLARMWQCSIATHPNAGHDLPLDAPHWVGEQVRDWLAQS